MMVNLRKYEVWTDAGRNTALHPCGGMYIIAAYSENAGDIAENLRVQLLFNGWEAEIREGKG